MQGPVLVLGGVFSWQCAHMPSKDSSVCVVACHAWPRVAMHGQAGAPTHRLVCKGIGSTRDDGMPGHGMQAWPPQVHMICGGMACAARGVVGTEANRQLPAHVTAQTCLDSRKATVDIRPSQREAQA